MLLNSSKEINTGGWFDNLRQRYAQTSLGFSEVQATIFQQPFVRSSYIQPGELSQISISNNGELNYLMRRYNSGQETYLPLKAPREFTEKIFLAADQIYTDACLILRHQHTSKAIDEITLTIHPFISTRTVNLHDDANTGQFDGLIVSDSSVNFNQCEPRNFKSLKYVKLPFHSTKKTSDINRIGYSLIYFPIKDVLISTGHPLVHPHLWVMKQPFSDEAKWEFILVSQIDNLCFTLMDDEFSRQSILEIILSTLETYQQIDHMNIPKKRSLLSCESLFSAHTSQTPTKIYDDSLCCSACRLL
jgi:hypothetical protein